MTRIELFTEGGVRVYDNREVLSDGVQSYRNQMTVGTTHSVSGWKARIRAVCELVDG